MSRIHSRDTSPELRLRRALWAAGLRYRLHAPLPGHPDIAIPRARVAIFVDGCFWHGCPRHYMAPSTRTEFWAKKLQTNISRDALVDAELTKAGWYPVHVWQHDILSGMPAVVGQLVKYCRDPGQALASAALEHADSAGVWWQCSCGGTDVQVMSVSSPGSLKAGSKNKPASATVRCRRCDVIRSTEVR